MYGQVTPRTGLMIKMFQYVSVNTARHKHSLRTWKNATQHRPDTLQIGKSEISKLSNYPKTKVPGYETARSPPV